MWVMDIKDTELEVNIDSSVPVLSGQTVKTVFMTQHQDRLYPETITANKGDILIISFADKNVTTLEIPGYDLTQKVKVYNFELFLDKQGTFEIYCHDCVSKFPTVLIVE